MSIQGKHCLLEAVGCSPSRLNDAAGIERALRAAIDRVGATLLDLSVRTFSPQGVTAVALLAESHASIHTWPEHGYAAIDAFTCGSADPAAICRDLAEALDASRVQERIADRGPCECTASPRDHSQGATSAANARKETVDV